MARSRRIEYPGAVYHVTSRGNARVKDYRWSSYRATAGHAKKPELLTTDWLLEQFTFSRSRAKRAYRRFVSQGANASPWENLRGQIYLGSDSFIDNLPQADDSLLEVPSQQRLVSRPSLLELLTPDQNIDTIYRAYRVSLAGLVSPGKGHLVSPG